jgi:hypothetical protein
MKQKIKWYILFFFLFAVLGFLREFYFVNMNNILYMKWYNATSVMPVPDLMKPFLNLEYDTLYYLKYPATVICTLLYFFLSVYALRVLTNNRSLTRILVYVYTGLFVFAAITMAYGFLKGHWTDDEYTISRWLMGIVQSPIICLILLASEKLYTKSFQS